MIQGDTSALEMYGTCSWFFHNAPAVDSMLKDCLQDLTRLFHFVDDWELDDNDFEWNEVFDYPKDDHDDDAYAASRCVKFSLIEDTYVKQCQQCVKFGKWVTADESRLAKYNGIIHLVRLDPIQNQSVPVLHSTLLL